MSLSFAPSDAELSQTRFRWDWSSSSDPSARRGSRRSSALFRDLLSGIRLPCRTSTHISRRRHRSLLRPKHGWGPSKLRASPSSCSPALTAELCSTRWPSCAANTVGAVFLEDLVDRLPEAERAVANGDFWGDLQPALLHLNQQLTPALRALASANLEADKFLLALRCRADQHQHAFRVVFHPGLQVDTVRPDIHVSSCRQIALLPAVILILPFGRQSGNHCCRQVRRVLAHETRQHLLKVAHRDAT